MSSLLACLSSNLSKPNLSILFQIKLSFSLAGYMLLNKIYGNCFLHRNNGEKKSICIIYDRYDNHVSHATQI